MSIIKVKEYLKKYKLDNKIIELDSSSATVKLASLALNCNEDEIAKTLSFRLKDGNYILIVMSGLSRLNNKKYKDFFGCKASMIKQDEVESIVGHKVGGVCPFAVNDNIKIYLDESLKKHEFVFPACGSSNSAIKLKIEQLENIINYECWVDITEKE